MSRLQKKCLIASGTLHVLLILILITTSAFLIKEEEHVDQQVLTFIPDQLVDQALPQAAARPATAVPTPTPEPPKPRTETKPPEPKPEPPKPKPEPEKKPEPVKPRVEPRVEPKVEPKPKVEPEPPKPKPKPIEVDLTKKVVRTNQPEIDREKQRREEQLKKQQQEFEKQRQQALNSLSSIEKKLTEAVGATAIDLGTVGVSYASYDSWVQKVYWDAWQPPTGLAAGNSVVKARVVIRRDGSVESSTVTGLSGVTRLDTNIRQLLNRVTTMGRPFPEGAKEAKRTYNIEFNLEAKLGTG